MRLRYIRINPRGRRPRSLVEYLREAGGVKDPYGDLRSREPDRERPRGSRKLIQQKTGRPLDEAREAAAERGYLPQHSSIPDFLDLIDLELRGRKVYSIADAHGFVDDDRGERLPPEGWKPGRTSYGKPTVPPHSSARHCKRCQIMHTKGAHRFHGEGAFHRTHLFSFKSNPRVPPGFKPPESFTRFLIERHYLPGAIRPDLIAGLYQDAKLRKEYMEWIRGGSLITPESEGQRGLFNPRRGRKKILVKVYGHVLRVEAQKTGAHQHCDAACKRARHNYVHDFKRGVKMYGLSPGMVFIVPRGKWPLLIMK